MQLNVFTRRRWLLGGRVAGLPACNVLHEPDASGCACRLDFLKGTEGLKVAPWKQRHISLLTALIQDPSVAHDCEDVAFGQGCSAWPFTLTLLCRSKAPVRPVRRFCWQPRRVLCRWASRQQLQDSSAQSCKKTIAPPIPAQDCSTLLPCSGKIIVICLLGACAEYARNKSSSGDEPRTAAQVAQVALSWNHIGTLYVFRMREFSQSAALNFMEWKVRVSKGLLSWPDAFSLKATCFCWAIVLVPSLQAWVAKQRFLGKHLQIICCQCMAGMTVNSEYHSAWITLGISLLLQISLPIVTGHP